MSPLAVAAALSAPGRSPPAFVVATRTRPVSPTGNFGNTLFRYRGCAVR